MTLRLVLADDHPVVLKGLETLLGTQPDLDILALCTDGLEAVEAAKEHRPDVLIMDASMPGCNGLEAFVRIRDAGFDVPTVILTASLDDDTLVEFVKSAVGGIVLKEAAPSDLVEAIRTVADGGRWVGPELTARVLQVTDDRTDEDGEGLTPREKEVVLHVAAGNSNRRVASQLGIAESTVKLHLHSAFKKLDVSNRTQLSLVVRERGWSD